MYKYIQDTYKFSDYQMKILRFFFVTTFSEISKFVIVGLLFINCIPLYIWATFILHICRSSTGGIHCKSYLSCLITSAGFMVLSIYILPLFPIDQLIQLILLFICVLACYNIAPIVSDIHAPLKKEAPSRLKQSISVFIFIYFLCIYIFPQNSYLCVGFWVIILNSLQLIVASLMKGDWTYEKITHIIIGKRIAGFNRKHMVD